MSVTVTSGQQNNVTVTQKNQSYGAIVVKRGDGITVQGLSNVVSTDLQDGYTLVYDSATSKWVTQPVSASIGSVDGGTY